MLISAATYDSGASGIGGAVVETITSPFRKAAKGISDGVSKFFNSFKSYDSYNDQIDELNDKISKLEGQLADYEQIKQENERYEEYLDLKAENNDYTFTAAEVMTDDSISPFYTFTIDKGSKDEISVNDPVIKGSYLVGVVTKVTQTYSVVTTILSPDVNVSAYEIRTRQTGVVCGDAELSLKNECKMEYLSRDTGISSQSIVCTSGVGGIFPRGLIIGTVDSIKNNDHDISAYAVINPSVDFEKLKDVFVITYFDGQGSGDADED